MSWVSSDSNSNIKLNCYLPSDGLFDGYLYIQLNMKSFQSMELLNIGTLKLRGNIQYYLFFHFRKSNKI